MTERDIVGNVRALVDSYKNLEKTSGKEKHSHEIVAETALISLVTGILVDLNRIAGALELLATKHAYPVGTHKR